MKITSMFTFLFLLVVGTSSAQSFDADLLAGFTQSELETMQKDDPQELAFWEFFVKQGFVFKDYPAGKNGGLDPNTAVSVTNESSFNPLTFGLKPHKEARTYYPLANSNRMVMILPRTEISAKLKAQKTK